MIKFIVVLFVVFVSLSVVSAGLGIYTDKNSLLVNEGESVCINNIKAYNPFPTDTYAMISVSDELQGVLTNQEVDEKLIPAGTSSSNAIPMEFCFKVPDNVYEKQRAPIPLVGNVIKKIDCTGQDMKEYAGEVILQSTPGPAGSDYAGSATVMSVSTPLNIRVKCKDQKWDLIPVYVFVAVLSAGIIGLILFRRYRTPKAQRMKQQMAKLRKEMKKK